MRSTHIDRLQIITIAHPPPSLLFHPTSTNLHLSLLLMHSTTNSQTLHGTAIGLPIRGQGWCQGGQLIGSPMAVPWSVWDYVTQGLAIPIPVDSKPGRMKRKRPTRPEMKVLAAETPGSPQRSKGCGSQVLQVVLSSQFTRIRNGVGLVCGQNPRSEVVL